ncbi:MAG: hypothetical protein ACYDH1_06885 [Anaerolineaceae bacterium]
MNIINPFTVMIIFAMVLACLAYFKPRIGKIVTGIFFLIMAFGVNVPILFTNPTLFSVAGEKAFLPIYRWFFTDILKNYPVPFVIALILFEATTGILILSKGKAMKIGLLAASLFCLFLAPIGLEEITSPALIVSFAILWRKADYTKNRIVSTHEWVATI